MPAAIMTSPAEPLVLTPLVRITTPEFCSLEALEIETLPEAIPPAPVTIDTSPPAAAASAVSPDLIETFAPAPDPLEPAARLIEPASADALSPVVRVSFPEEPPSAPPVKTERSPED
jgi:hypothetical protein